MKNSRYLSSEVIDKINKMAEKGIPDVEISKALNMSFGTVNQRTTKYWKNKMQNAERI